MVFQVGNEYRDIVAVAHCQPLPWDACLLLSRSARSVCVVWLARTVFIDMIIDIFRAERKFFEIS